MDPRLVRAHRAVLLAVLCFGAASAPLLGQDRAERRARGPSLRARDLVAVQRACGGAEPTEGALDVIRSRMAAGNPSQDGEVLAFEDNSRFLYAVVASGGGSRAQGGETAPEASRRVRRLLLLKPATLVVEDSEPVRASGGAVRWTFRADDEIPVEGRRFRVLEAGVRVLGETLVPDVAPSRPERGVAAEHRVEVTAEGAPDRARFLHVFRIGAAAETAPPTTALRRGDDGRLDLSVTAEGRVLQLALPSDPSRAGEIEIADASGQDRLPRRFLPSGILPHGPDGARLVERWDAPYRGSRPPGWDVGRPSSALTQAVRDGAVKPGRAIVLGCGTGTNAIYLASQGFDVTAVDVAPTALTLGRDKAREAGVEVRWLLADVLALPQLEPFDIVFDRGCYHHVRRYDAPGYVETVLHLSRPGTRVLILAARQTGEGRGGPPPVEEEEIRDDFSELFEIEWLREIRFDRPAPGAQGSPAWSALLRRRSDSD